LGVLLTVDFHNGEVFRWDVIRDDKLIVGCRIEDAGSCREIDHYESNWLIFRQFVA
jgi:hypothetical protein